MASLTRLRRRLLRWERYAARTVFDARIRQPWAYQPPRGYQRAAGAVSAERWHRAGRCPCAGDPSAACVFPGGRW